MPMILPTWEAKLGRIVVQNQPRQKLSKTPISINKLYMVAHTYGPSYVGGQK
jgi:hypothetical protein